MELLFIRLGDTAFCFAVVKGEKMRKKFLLILLFVSVVISAWGLVIDEAFAQDLPQNQFRNAAETAQVPFAQRAPLGITAPPLAEGELRAPVVTEDREPVYGSSSSSDSGSDSSD